MGDLIGPDCDLPLIGLYVLYLLIVVDLLLQFVDLEFVVTHVAYADDFHPRVVITIDCG